MKLTQSILLLFATLICQAAEPPSEFAAGRASYLEGDFRKALSHFELAVRANPEDAECYYWMGMSYQVLADIATPFDGKYRSKARIYLTKATELAPQRRDFRQDLFDLLLDSGSSRAARLQAAAILRAVPEPDPDYIYMRRRFDQEQKTARSAEAVLGRVFLAVPRAAYGMGDGISAVARISAAPR